MFPWVYEFRWSAGHLIFLGVFFSVAAMIASTLVAALLRTFRDFRKNDADAVRWHVDFEDLPSSARVCRHELTGEVQHRTCHHEFACGTCTGHPQFLLRHTPAAATEDTLYGMHMPGDRMYHRGHTWVRKEDDGTCTVGLDALAERILGDAGGEELPPAGTEIRANGPAWRMSSQGTPVRILAPIDGTVIATGSREQGWYLRVMPREGCFAHLLRGEEIRPWITREIDRLQYAIAPDGGVPTLADGGELVGDLRKQSAGADWDAVLGEMFLEA
jgi:glycine cleavage system H lipoate-binding protein